MMRAKRRMLQWAAIAFATTCGWAASDARPNIVFILADDLGYGDVGALNRERGRIRTPHLDRLIEEGMLFSDAHSGSSVCTPTRYGVLTGRYAWRTRLQKGVLEGTNDEPLIAVHRLTWPGFLRQQGYATAALGKWHLGFRPETPPASSASAAKMGYGGLPVGTRIAGGPLERGFDHFHGFSNSRTMSGLIVDDRVAETIEPVEALPRLVARAERYIGERAGAAKDGKPFFLYLALTSPHTPIVPAAAWRGKSGLGDYGDFVLQTDAAVGAVLGALEQHDLVRHTVVVFTSDNGCSPEADTGQLEARGHFASGPYRGYKADIWEGGHRAPLIIRWPGRVAPGTRHDRVVCLTDFFATSAELLGAALPDNAAEDSVSLLPALLGRPSSRPRAAVVHHSIDGRFAIREGRWKLAFCAGSGGWSEPRDPTARQQGLPALQLYDLEHDPAESRNLAGDHPEIVRRLTETLQHFIAQGRSTPGAAQANDTAVTPF